MNRNILVLILLAIFSTCLLNAREDWQSVSVVGVNFEYKVTEDKQNLEGIMSAQTTGWISVGFNPTLMMNEANIIIGYVEDGAGFIRDDWGTGINSHASDTSLGGTDDVTLVEAQEVDGVTTIHFIIPLDSGDQYDQPLSIGETYPVCIARGPDGANNFSTQHAAAGMGEITILAPTSAGKEDVVTPFTDGIISIHPNPFENRTQIRYRMQESSQARFSFYNLKGQLVRRVISEDIKGENILDLQTKGLPCGIYLIQMKTNRTSDSRRITIINH